MKKLFVIMSLNLASTAFANTVSVYRFDDVDTVMANGKTILVEDIRDGFTTIKGVQVNDESVNVSSESKALILLRNSVPNKLFDISTMAAKVGGDMGGG